MKFSLLINKRIFSQPWGYTESYIIAFSLAGIGFFIDRLTRHIPIISIHSTFSLIAVILFVAILLYLSTVYASNSIIKWLSTVPAAISSISVFIALSALYGLTIGIQVQRELYFHARFKPVFTFFISALYLLTSLGLLIFRRSRPLKLSDMGFLTMHLGLWITIAAVLAGAVDTKRLIMSNVRLSKEMTDSIVERLKELL